MLPSGLPEHVDDEEEVARFLTQSSQFNATMVKPAALLPNPKTVKHLFRVTDGSLPMIFGQSD